ncbi:hypothetical protein ACFSUJ_00195 [Streptomyces lusitanus]|uniref:Uncharacterized protein n=1 Tax=Streptomyces lusitanus TaxID=68232 RepID=A0ABU3K0N9_9ACTN|nr:hypothetical protein [Streptomyces lusitanus]
MVDDVVRAAAPPVGRVLVVGAVSLGPRAPPPLTYEIEVVVPAKRRGDGAQQPFDQGGLRRQASGDRIDALA